jgi:hypothetical protein
MPKEKEAMNATMLLAYPAAPAAAARRSHTLAAASLAIGCSGPISAPGTSWKVGRSRDRSQKVDERQLNSP